MSSMPTPQLPMPERNSLSVVVPIYNGAATVDLLVERLTAALRADGRRFEIILVNDGSHDDSWTRIEALAQQSDVVRGIDLMRNYGQHNALLCGIRAARHEFVVTMDDDLQHPPEEISRLLAKADEGFDVVYGVLVRERHGWLRTLASRCTKLVLKHAMEVRLGHRFERLPSVSDGAARCVRRLPEPVFVDRCPAELEHHPLRQRYGTARSTPRWYVGVSLAYAGAACIQYVDRV